MAGFMKGDVIVLPFPYSDLSQTKWRPAVVMAVLPGSDIILCQITSQTVTDGDALPLNNTDFVSGMLSKPSNIRPNKLFTADSSIVLYRVGTLKQSVVDDVVKKTIEVLQR